MFLWALRAMNQNIAQPSGKEVKNTHNGKIETSYAELSASTAEKFFLVQKNNPMQQKPRRQSYLCRLRRTKQHAPKVNNASVTGSGTVAMESYSATAP